MASSSLQNIISRNFPGINAFQISVVENTEPVKDYLPRFFMFVKAIPGVKSDQSPTGRTYNYQNAITIKVEAEKALGLAFALRTYAEGRGEAFEQKFGNFEIFADASKSNFTQGGKKLLRVSNYKNNKTHKDVISLGMMAGDNKIPLLLTPYEAYGMGQMIEILARKCIELELAGPGISIKKEKTQLPNLNDPFQNNVNKVTDDFSNVFKTY